MSNLHKYYAEFSGEKEIVTAEPQEKIKPEPSSELSNLHQYYGQQGQSEKPQKTYSGSAALETVTDFETNPQVIKDYETVMDALARNKTYTSGILDTAAYSDDGPAEFLRDLTMRISTKVNLATEAGDWSPQEKQAFTRLQSNWNKVSVTGMREWASAIKDYGIDAVANLETIPAIASLIFQGGTGVAAAQVGARTALSKVLAKVAVASQPTTKTGFAAMGAAYGLADDISLQNLEIETGQKEEFNKAQTYTTAAVGALAGAGLKKGIELFQGRNTSKVSKALAEQDLNVKLVAEVPEDQGIKVFEDSLVDESMPVSANDVIVDLGKLVESTPNITGATIADILEDSASSISINIKKLAKDSGGGKKTVEEIENIVIQSVERGATGKEIRSLTSHGIWKGITAVVGKTYGKASGLLTPYVKYSNDAKELQKKFNFQFGIGYRTTEDLVGKDFSETAARITGDLNVKFMNNVEPIAMHQLTGEVEDSVNDALNLAVRGKASGIEEIDVAGKKIKATFKTIGGQLKKYGLIKHDVENYFPRMWDRKAIDEGQDELANIFVDVGEAKNFKEGQAIVAEMLDKQNQISSGTSGHFFSSTRAFENIKDDSKVVKFLNPDIRTTIMDYNFQAGKALAKKIIFDVTNEEQFINRWVNGIDSDMRKAGQQLSKKDKLNIVDLYRTATGENLTRYSPEVQNVADAYTLTTRVALLGGVTVSSLTEIMVNLGKAGFRNTAKGFVEATELAFKKATGDIHSELKSKHGLTTAEAYREHQSVGLAMDQASSQIGQHRIGGGDLNNEKMQRISNKFFRITLLDQWTKYVQRVSFAASKNFIEENLNTIAKHGTLKPTKKIKSIMGELKELDINPEQGAEWIRNGSKRSDKFYQNIINGSARYTNQVILHPSGMTGNKPLLHAKPTTTILFQLMGYPAAFTNTVLKGGFQQLVKDPTRNGFKLASTALLMTETARMTNWIRSRGESEKNKSTEEIYTAAIARWGGFGLAADQAIKGEKALDYNRSVGATIATSLGGPAISDLNTLLTRGPIQTAQQKVPFSSLGNAIVGKQKMKEWRKLGRKADTALKEALDIEEDYRATFKKGGEVNIPNAPAEPDERINKLTGLPYNYEAGASYMDEDDPLRTVRKGFALGSIVKGATKLVSKAFSPKGDSGFFSMAEKKAMEIQRGKGTGAEFINELKSKGVTEDELEFTGFNNEFASKPKVTKEEVVGYLNVNRLDVTESVGYLPDRKGIEEAERAQIGAVFDDIPDDPINQIRNKLEQTEAELDDLIEIENSRALTSDEEDLMNQLAEEIELLQSDYAIRSEDPFGEFGLDDIPAAMLVEGSDFNPELIHKQYAWNGLDTVNYREVAIKVPDEKSGIEKPFKPYTTRHFPEQENVIAHVRFGDIFSPNPKDKILLIDEGQSDFWQQKSRYGKRDKIKFPDYKDQIQDSIDKGELYYDKLKKELDIAQAENSQYTVTSNSAEVGKIELEQVRIQKELDSYYEELTNRNISDAREEELSDKIDLLEYELKGNTEMIEDYTTDYTNPVPAELVEKIANLESKLEDTSTKLVDLSASIKENYISEYAPTPDMPFMPRKSTGVTKLTMNRALIEAAKGDYNTVSFTTAQQQMDRYNISGDKGKSFIEKYDKDIPKFFTEFLKKYNQELVIKKVYKQGEDDAKRTLVEVPSFTVTEQMRTDILRGRSQFNKGGKVLNKLKRNCNK
jgi:hypothetical protein